jgi:acetyl esterase/lipase
MIRYPAPWITNVAALLALVPVIATAAEPRVQRDIEYARAGEHSLRLDLYLPAGANQPPLVVWVHGGAWRSGSKESMPLGALVSRGYAVASIDYRLSPVAAFPAQAHDLKAAIRFLRAQAARYGYDPQRVAIAGASAGAHLAALVGVSGGDERLEGDLGAHRDQSSRAQAIVSFYGMSNLTTILAQSTPHGLKVRVPALKLLLGGQPDQKPELARLASPVFHVDAGDPPLLLLHGDQDPQAPINQSHELEGAYQRVGNKVHFEVVHGAAHGGPAFYDEQRLKLVAEFLQRSLAASQSSHNTKSP